MTGRSVVVIDACVLANFSLCDTLLRIAEHPSLFDPKWSDEIMDETVRTLESKLKWPRALAEHFRSELRASFSDAWVREFHSLLPAMTNDEKDRHVLAAAVRSRTSLIVTFNLRHFRSEHLLPWGIRALHPQTFLVELLRDDPGAVIAKLRLQASDRKRTLEDLLQVLKQAVPDFAISARKAAQDAGLIGPLEG